MRIKFESVNSATLTAENDSDKAILSQWYLSNGIKYGIDFYNITSMAEMVKDKNDLRISINIYQILDEMKTGSPA